VKKLLALLLALVATAALAQSSTGINGGGPNTLPGSGPAHEVLATPSTGPGQVSLRALTAADVPPITSGTITGAFTGTCNSSTYLNGGGSCTAPIQTAYVASTVTCSGGGGACSLGLSFTGLSTSLYGLSCFINVSSSANGGELIFYLALSGAVGFYSEMSIAGSTIAGTSASLSAGDTPISVPATASGITITAWITPNSSDISILADSTTSSATITVAAGSFCELVKP
jgi:hypothetical protein